MKKVVILLCKFYYYLLIQKKGSYTKFQWRTFREKIILKLRYNYALETKENFETLIYQGIEHERIRFRRIEKAMINKLFCY